MVYSMFYLQLGLNNVVEGVATVENVLNMRLSMYKQPHSYNLPALG